jgi:hypothetical protein
MPTESYGNFGLALPMCRGLLVAHPSVYPRVRIAWYRHEHFSPALAAHVPMVGG